MALPEIVEALETLGFHIDYKSETVDVAKQKIKLVELGQKSLPKIIFELLMAAVEQGIKTGVGDLEEANAPMVYSLLAEQKAFREKAEQDAMLAKVGSKITLNAQERFDSIRNKIRKEKSDKMKGAKKVEEELKEEENENEKDEMLKRILERQNQEEEAPESEPEDIESPPEQERESEPQNLLEDEPEPEDEEPIEEPVKKKDKKKGKKKSSADILKELEE